VVEFAVVETTIDGAQLDQADSDNDCNGVMSVIKFCGFDYTNRDGNPVNASTAFNNTVVDMALDSGMLVQSFGNDAVSYAPGTAASIFNVASQGRNASDGGAMGFSFAGGLTSLGAYNTNTQGVTCTRQPWEIHPNCGSRWMSTMGFSLAT